MKQTSTAAKIGGGMLMGALLSTASPYGQAADSEYVRFLPSKAEYFRHAGLNEACHDGTLKMSPSLQAYRQLTLTYFRKKQTAGGGTDYSPLIRQIEADEVPKELVDGMRANFKNALPSGKAFFCKNLDNTTASDLAMANMAIALENNPDPNSPEAKKALQGIAEAMRRNSEVIRNNLPVIAQNFKYTPEPNAPGKAPAKAAAPVPARQLTTLENTTLLAQQGNPKAQYNMGLYHLRGEEGAEKDEAKAAEWFRKAAEQDDTGAQAILGRLYEQGQGVPKDDTQAVLWFGKAAEKGNAGAQINLGSHYQHGTGVALDEHAAFDWYRKAALQNSATGEFNLGLMYAQAKGTERNYPEAKNWLEKAANQGMPAAQFTLALLYMGGGDGMPANPPRAYFWFAVANAQGYKDSDKANVYRDKLAASMPKDLLAATDAEAAAWKPQPATP